MMIFFLSPIDMTEANEHFTRVCNQNNDPGYNVRQHVYQKYTLLMF